MRTKLPRPSSMLQPSHETEATQMMHRLALYYTVDTPFGTEAKQMIRPLAFGRAWLKRRG